MEGAKRAEEAGRPEKRAARRGESPYPPPLYAWYVVGVLMLFYIFSFVDRQIIALLVEPMKADLSLTDIEVSLIGGLSFVIFYTLFGIPIGRLADSRSRRGIIAIGVAIWSVMTSLCAFSRHFFQLLILRMGVGVGEAALSPSAFSLITDYFPARKRATALSVYSMGIYFGSGLAFTGGALILKWATALVEAREGQPFPIFGSIQPWQIVLLSVGLPGLFLTILLKTVKEPERRGLGEGLGFKKKGKLTGIPLGQVFRFFRENWKTVLLHNLGIAFLSLAGYSGGFWDAAFLERVHGWKPQDSGIWYGLVTMAAGALGVLSGGRLADFLTARGIKSANMLAIFIASVIWLPFGIGYPLMPNVGLTLTLLFPTLFTAAMPYGCAAAAIQEMMPPQMRGQAAALYLFFINIIGLGVGPTAVAFLTEHVFHDLNTVNLSLVCIGGGGHLLAAGILWMSFKPYVTTVEKAGRWVAPTRGFHEFQD